MSACPPLRRMLSMLLTFSAAVTMAAVESETATVRVPLQPFGLASTDHLVTSTTPAVVPLNIALARRVVLAPQDVQAAQITLSCCQVLPIITPFAHGVVQHAATVRLDDEVGLQALPLTAGDEVALTIWKSDYHMNGSGTVTGLRIVHLAPDGTRQEVLLPERFTDGSAATPIGRFTLVGLANRDRFPICAQREAVVPGGKAGDFQVPSGHGAGLGISGPGEIRFWTTGRGNNEAKYEWAPALLFQPARDGIYTITGTLSFRVAGKPESTMRWMLGRLTPEGAPLVGTTVHLHRLVRAPQGPTLSPADYDPTPIATHRVTGEAPLQQIDAPLDVTAALRQWLDGTWVDHGVAVVAKRTDGRPAQVLLSKTAPAVLTVTRHPKQTLFSHDVVPQRGVYATMRDGRLYYGDKRLRLWGMVKDGPAERVRRLGFNCLRAWFQADFYDAASAKRGEVMRYTPGDGSSLDRFDRLMADLKQHDLFVMFATMVGQGIPMKPLLDDDSWIAGGADWQEWKAAVIAAGDRAVGFGYFDDRLWKIRLRHAENVLNHVNPYTQQRYAEEEIIALIEINNEANLIKRWLDRGFADWPPYFRNQLQAQWNGWLAAQYGDQAGIQSAWGALDTDESLGAGTIRLEPIFPNRKHFPVARQRDFVRFICERIDQRNQQYRDFCRSLAPAGVGVAVVPFSFDSMYQPNTPWLWSIGQGDTSTVSMYFWHHDSALTKPPSLYVLDSNRLDDRLSVIYETQRGRPSPYRAEYPYALAAMTCWQDFDIVVWHGSWFNGRGDEELLAGSVPPPMPTHFWMGVHLEHDPVMTSAIALAGRLFLSGALEVAPDPAIVSIGVKGALSYEAWHGVGGRENSLDTFQRGTRIRFDPEREGGVLIDGKPRAPQAAPSGPISTGRYVTWDWQQGRLIIDAPTAKVYVGPAVAAHRFTDGITLSGLNSAFVSFALISADGRPLTGPDAGTKAWVSAVFDARNTGFDFDFSAPGGPVEQAKAVRALGHAPVLVDPVEYTLSFPTALEGRFTGYDFAMRQVIDESLRDENTLRRRGETLWMGLLTVDGRGAAREPQIDPSPGVTQGVAIAQTGAVETTDPALADLANPLPNLSWGDNAERAHRQLRDSAIVRTRITISGHDAAQRVITIRDVEGVFPQPANVDVAFVQDRMQRITVLFDQAPALSDLIAALTAMHGAPVTTALVNDAFAQSEVHWQASLADVVMRITAREVQGVVGLEYVLQR